MPRPQFREAGNRSGLCFDALDVRDRVDQHKEIGSCRTGHGISRAGNPSAKREDAIQHQKADLPLIRDIWQKRSRILSHAQQAGTSIQGLEWRFVLKVNKDVQSFRRHCGLG